jgi:hypothetical protein
LAFAVIMAGASVALASHQVPDESAQAGTDGASAPETTELTTFSGMITDSYCGARHVRYRKLSPAQCAAACIRDGGSYVLVNGDRRYKLSGSHKELSKVLGTRANVTGTLEGDTIVVKSAGPMF